MIADIPRTFPARVDGFYVAPDGCHYETRVDFVQCHVLEFCTCGRPGDNLFFILQVLELIAEKSPDNPKAWDTWWDGHKKRRDALFATIESQYFMWYWLDAEGLTEHGTGMPGWLTPKGENLLALLREFHASREAWEDQT